jgi:hypothetical protein
MFRRSSFASVALAFAVALTAAGCDSDSPTGTTNDTAVARTAIGSGDVGSGPVFLRAQGGAGVTAFTLRGDDVRSEGAALLADFTVINDGDASVPVPATLTLVSLDPSGVTVAGADNGETGAGASFDLSFADDDGEWSVGESTEPRTLRFETGGDVSVAFVARVDFAMSESGGSIGGTVFADGDGDGTLDGGESGIGGVTVELRGNGFGPVLTTSAADGTYRFDGLDAGAYTVREMAESDLQSTSAGSIQVLLATDADGGVVDYLGADFGFRSSGGGSGSLVEVGDHVEVDGWYDMDSGRFLAREVEWDHEDFEWDLDGPVTSVDASAGTLGVMGVVLSVSDAMSHDDDWLDDCAFDSVFDFTVGDFAEVDGDYVGADGSGLRVDDVDCDDADDRHEVEGRVDRVEVDGSGHLVWFEVLGVRIDVDRRTEFEYGDEHRGDDDRGDDDSDDDDDDDYDDDDDSDDDDWDDDDDDSDDD